MNLNLPINIGVSGYYEVRLRRPDGRVVPFKGHEKPIKNIITNNGRDSVFTRTFLASMAYLVVGTGARRRRLQTHRWKRIWRHRQRGALTKTALLTVSKTATRKTTARLSGPMQPETV